MNDPGLESIAAIAHHFPMHPDDRRSEDCLERTYELCADRCSAINVAAEMARVLRTIHPTGVRNVTLLAEAHRKPAMAPAGGPHGMTITPAPARALSLLIVWRDKSRRPPRRDPPPRNAPAAPQLPQEALGLLDALIERWAQRKLESCERQLSRK